MGHAETSKCDTWSVNSLKADGSASIECEKADTVDDCVKKIMVKQLWLKMWNLISGLRLVNYM